MAETKNTRDKIAEKIGLEVGEELPLEYEALIEYIEQPRGSNSDTLKSAGVNEKHFTSIAISLSATMVGKNTVEVLADGMLAGIIIGRKLGEAG